MDMYSSRAAVASAIAVAEVTAKLAGGETTSDDMLLARARWAWSHRAERTPSGWPAEDVLAFAEAKSDLRLADRRYVLQTAIAVCLHVLGRYEEAVAAALESIKAARYHVSDCWAPSASTWSPRDQVEDWRRRAATPVAAMKAGTMGRCQGEHAVFDAALAAVTR